MKAVIFLWLVASAGHGMIYQDNSVTFAAEHSGKLPNMLTLSGVAFTIRSFRITKGQDPDGNIEVGQKQAFAGSNGDFVFRIGHNRSKEVATWFSYELGRADRCTFFHYPGRLYFAFKGDLEVRVTRSPTSQTHHLIKDVLIAQGHAGLRNNWWFGGKTCYRTDDDDGDDLLRGHRVYCESEEDADGKVAYVRFQRGGFDPYHRIRVQKVVFQHKKPRRGNQTFLAALPDTKNTGLPVHGNVAPKGSMTLPVER
ncbi:unnamed protein product [Symbiodinium sp. CCMP2592]|nr:unnamed protein product [Symbiodinium sp. CCMP2592]